MDTTLLDLIEPTNFITRASVKTHGMLDEADIYTTVIAELANENVSPSVRNLAQHISSALQFAAENAQRRRAEPAVHESEQRFRQIVSVTPAIFWMASPDWKHLIHVSPAMEKVYGRTCESFCRQPELWLHVILPADGEWVLAHRGQLHGQKAEVEYRIVRPDGEVRWVKDCACPVHNKAG